MSSKNFIITGAPGTGKSSIIEELKKRGVQCYGEVAREVIIEETAAQSTALPNKDVLAFTEKVVAKMKEDLAESDQYDLCFFDRGLPDSAGYLLLENIDIPAYLTEEIKHANYEKTVFITPFWEAIYRTDEVRYETADHAKAIADALRKSYTHFNYKLIEIPTGTIDERADFVLEKITQLIPQ